MLLDQLKAFSAVVNEGGFERAREAIHLSQPAISIRIKELEKRFGVDLFYRVGKGVQLTDAGKVVEEYAARLLILISEMDQSIDELKGVQRGQLRCGASWTIGAHLLPRALVQFKQQFPNVVVKLVVGSTPEAEKKIVAGELDIALVAGQINNPAQFKIVHYLTDEFVLITPISHPLAKLQRVSLKRIAKLPLILREKGPLPRLLIDEAFRAAGISYNCTMEIASSEGMKRAVAEGLGCSIVSFSSIETELKVKALACIRISGTPIKREFRVILHKDRKILGPVKPFLKLLNINISSTSS